MTFGMNFLKYVFSRERCTQVTALTRDVPILLPSTQLTERVLPQVCVSTAGVFLVFAAFLRLFRNEKDQVRKYQLAHRFTNIVSFSVLMVIGIYGELFVIPQKPVDEVATFIQGMEENTVVVTTMFSFQLWSLIVGTVYVNESPLMRMHHVAVLVVAVLYAAFTNGFRYHGYYFAGIWEASSIPLALMNLFRDYPQWKERYPSLFFVVKALFAFSFLIVRIWIGTRRAIRYVTDIWLVFSVSFDKPFAYSVFMFLMAFMSTFLGLLQFYWAGLIVSMIAKNAKEILAPRKKKDV